MGPRLIDPALKGEAPANACVSHWLGQNFWFQADEEHPFTFVSFSMEGWPTRTHLLANMAVNGVIRAGCYEGAFAAAYGLWDLGVKARVVTCWIPVPASAKGAQLRHGKWMAYHMVCEDENGWVLDPALLPDTVETWPILEQVGYEKDIMSNFFESEEETSWTEAR